MKSEEDPAARDARVHAEPLAHRLKTETDDTVGHASQRVALEQVCYSLADLHQALVEGDGADAAAAGSEKSGAT